MRRCIQKSDEHVSISNDSSLQTFAECCCSNIHDDTYFYRTAINLPASSAIHISNPLFFHPVILDCQWHSIHTASQSLPRGVQSNSDNPFRQKGLSRNQSGCPAFKSNSDVNQLSSYTHSLQYRTFNGIYTVGGGAFPSPEKAKCVLRWICSPKDVFVWDWIPIPSGWKPPSKVYRE